MELGKALRKVMSVFGLTNARVSKESGVYRGMISRITRGKAEGTTWSTIEKLGEGLEKIDPAAKAMFLGVLQLPDDLFPELDLIGGECEWVAREEDPEAVKSVIRALIELGLPNEEIDKLRQKYIHLYENRKLRLDLETVVSLKMQEIRREDDQNE